MTTLQWIPDFIGWIFFVILIASIILSWWMYSRNKPAIEGWVRYLLVALRSITLTTAGLLIIHPQIIINRIEEKMPGISVWIDRSGSMDNTLSADDEMKFKESITKFSGDSIKTEFRYFGSAVSTELKNDAEWKSETNLTPVISESKSEINILITDGVIDDYEWLLGKSNNYWNVVLVGDTTQPTGIELKSASEKTIKAYEGDKVTIYATVIYQLKKPEGAEVEFIVSDSIKSVSVKMDAGSGSQLVSSSFTAPEAGEYTYTIRLKTGDKKDKSSSGKLIVGSRIQQVYIISHQSDPVIGFLKRRLSSIGTVKTQIITDNNLTNLPEINTKMPVMYILVNYPQSETALYKKIKLSLNQSNMIMVSNEETIPEVRNMITPRWTVFPLFVSGQTWMPLLGQFGGDISFWTGWSESGFREMPPFTSPIRFVPEFNQSPSFIQVDQQPTSYPSHIVRESTVKRSWILKGNFDEWERWDAVNNMIPPRITVSSTDFLVWMLTPSGTKSYRMQFQSLASGKGIEGILNLNREKATDSIAVNMKWNSQNYSMLKNKNQLYSVRLPNPDEEKTRYSYQIYKNGKLQYEDSGLYEKPSYDFEKEVKYALTEPLKSWILSNNGWANYQSINYHALKLQINDQKKADVKQSHYDSWNNMLLFLLIVSCSGVEWLIRKRLGSL